MSYQVDSYGNAYFPAGVSVASIPATTGTQNKVLVPGPDGRISSASISQLITQSGSNIVTSVYGRTGAVVPRQGDYDTDLVTEGQALYFTDSRARKALSVTTFNTSGPATYDSTTGIINIPQYGSGIVGNYVPVTRTITINGQTADLSANRIFSIDSMVYPSAGIPLSNGTSWGTSIVNNSANWNTAFGWGDHAGLYSLLGHTHTFASLTSIPTTLAGYGITDAATSAQGTKADTAFSWGNHALAGYLTSFTETDPIYTASTWYTTTNNATNWNTAYTWGNHALAGYLTSFTETDPVWASEKANYALKTYVDTSISNLVDSAPTTLDTLNELAAALGDDANFSTTVTNLIGTKEPAITAGTTAQYWRGDKTWQTLPVYTLSSLGGEPVIAAGNTNQYWRGDKTWQVLPVYTLSGLGGVPSTRTLTINGTTYDLSANRSWTIAAGVSSFNTRTGDITLTSADVTGALGYTPYNSTNPSGYITGNQNITLSGDVTGSGATSIVTTVANNAVTTAKINNGAVTAAKLATFGAGEGIYWAANTDGASIIFESTGDGASGGRALSNLLIALTDNGDEGLKVTTTGAELLYVNTNQFQYKGNTVWTAASLTNLNQLTNGPGYITGISSTTVINALGYTPYNSSNPIGYITSSASISGASARLSSRDNRVIAPSEDNAAELRFGFTAWNNNDAPDWADYLHLRSYSDNSGGADNLVMFKKSGIGMRIWQQSFGSGTAYSSYVDILHSSNYNSYSPTLTGGGASGNWAISITGNANNITAYTINQNLGTGNSPSFADGIFGTTSGATDQGIQIRYQNYASGYGRIRFYQSDSNHSTIHSFSNSWQSGSLAGHSTGAINIEGNTGVTIGAWNNADMWIDKSGNAQARGSLRAPIFYDSNDTSYYLDPNTTGVSLNVAGIVRGSYFVASNYASTGYTQYKGYDNNNHFIMIRGRVTGNTSSPTYTGYHRTSLVEYAEANDDTGWFFQTAATGNYDIVARITRSYSQFEGSVRAPLFYDSDNPSYYLDPNSNSRLLYAQYDNIGVGQGYNSSYRIITSGDIYLNSNGNGWAEGVWKQRRSGGTYYDVIDAGNIGSQSVNNSNQLGGWSLQNVVPYHSGSDFPNGTLVVTSINASVTYGDSFVMEVTGKSYGSGAGPFALLLEGYIYADTFINVGALSYGGYFPGPIRIFNYGGNLAFWWPRASYWNSFSVKVREAGGSASNRVTSISDSGEPSSSKKVSITPVQSLHSSNYNSYSPTLTGGNASGTWGINITGSASTLSNNATISGLNFGGVLALTGSGASTGNSTGARLSESYGPIWNLSNGATWHHQVINGSYLSGISAGGGNYGSGNYYGTGDVTAYYSDERLKTKITTITDAIEKIKSLEGFVYVENELARSLGYTNEKEQAGVSAQQIQAVLPQAVSLAPFDMQGVPETGEIISKTGENYLTVKYDRIVPLLIEGIKEQQKQIEELKNEIKELKNK